MVQLDKTSLNDNIGVGKPALVVVGGAQCMPCKPFRTMVENQVAPYHKSVSFYYVDIFEVKDTPYLKDVMTLPSIVVFNGSGVPVGSYAGAASKDRVEDLLSRL